MSGYWARHRLLFTLIVCVAIALITSMLFVSPCVLRQANYYNSQSIYKNSDIDFIAPEPSFDQVTELPGNNGIDKVFPYYLTKTQVNVNSTSRTTTVLLSDQFQNVGMTMYNDARLIEKTGVTYENPIFVDWQFCHDTSAKLGDTISINLGGSTVEYTITAVYETNSIYDGGAILAEVSKEQKDAIAQQSNNNGYSGMYISATDYETCQTYLQTEYRPLGRLKSPSQFSDDEQYQVHYNAIMSSGYANEITDFRIREAGTDKGGGIVMLFLGALLALAAIICFNILMARRGCEKTYFTKYCIPKGQVVKPYYTLAFWAELIISLAFYAVFIIIRIRTSSMFIPGAAIGLRVVVVPIAIVVAEVISLIRNRSIVATITRKVEIEMQKARECVAHEQNAEESLKPAEE